MVYQAIIQFSEIRIKDWLSNYVILAIYLDGTVITSGFLSFHFGRYLVRNNINVFHDYLIYALLELKMPIGLLLYRSRSRFFLYWQFQEKITKFLQLIPKITVSNLLVLIQISGYKSYPELSYRLSIAIMPVVYV